MNVNAVNAIFDPVAGYIAGLEAEIAADHKKFYEGDGRARISAALGKLAELRQRLERINRGA
jgi:hypothetical protein